MITITFHKLARAEASLLRKDDGKWFAGVRSFSVNNEQLELFTGDHEYKVQALMAAFDIVGVMQAALQNLADEEGMKDMEASVLAFQPARESQPDGPVADSVDGYTIKAGKE